MPGAVTTATAAVSLFIWIQLRGHHWIFRCLNFKQDLRFVFSYLTGRSLRGRNTYWQKDRMMILSKTKTLTFWENPKSNKIFSYKFRNISNYWSKCVCWNGVCHLRYWYIIQTWPCFFYQINRLLNTTRGLNSLDISKQGFSTKIQRLKIIFNIEQYLVFFIRDINGCKLHIIWFCH